MKIKYLLVVVLFACFGSIFSQETKEQKKLAKNLEKAIEYVVPKEGKMPDLAKAANSFEKAMLSPVIAENYADIAYYYVECGNLKTPPSTLSTNPSDTTFFFVLRNIILADSLYRAGVCLPLTKVERSVRVEQLFYAYAEKCDAFIDCVANANNAKDWKRVWEGCKLIERVKNSGILTLTPTSSSSRRTIVNRLNSYSEQSYLAYAYYRMYGDDAKNAATAYKYIQKAKSQPNGWVNHFDYINCCINLDYKDEVLSAYQAASNALESNKLSLSSLAKKVITYLTRKSYESDFEPFMDGIAPTLNGYLKESKGAYEILANYFLNRKDYSSLYDWLTGKEYMSYLMSFGNYKSAVEEEGKRREFEALRAAIDPKDIGLSMRTLWSQVGKSDTDATMKLCDYALSRGVDSQLVNYVKLYVEYQENKYKPGDAKQRVLDIKSQLREAALGSEFANFVLVNILQYEISYNSDDDEYFSRIEEIISKGFMKGNDWFDELFGPVLRKCAGENFFYDYKKHNFNWTGIGTKYSEKSPQENEARCRRYLMLAAEAKDSVAIAVCDTLRVMENAFADALAKHGNLVGKWKYVYDAQEPNSLIWITSGTRTITLSADGNYSYRDEQILDFIVRDPAYKSYVKKIKGKLKGVNWSVYGKWKLSDGKLVLSSEKRDSSVEILSPKPTPNSIRNVTQLCTTNSMDGTYSFVVEGNTLTLTWTYDYQTHSRKFIRVK